MNISPKEQNEEQNEQNVEENEQNVEEQNVTNVEEPNVEEPNVEEQNVEENEELEESIPAINQVQNAPTDFDPMLFIQLGDRVTIDSKYGKTTGTVYYRSLERISIKPDGISNKLYDFELEQLEDEQKEIYKEEYGVTDAYVIEKRTFESFVEQQDFRVNQIIDTFDGDGDLYKSYKIVNVDIDNDSIQIQGFDETEEKDEKDENEDIEEVTFNFTGIESDENFKIISIRELVPEEEIELKQVEPVEVEPVEESDDEIEIIGEIEIIRPDIYEEAESFEQKIPDTIQKIDALNDFIMSIDSSLQNNPHSLREIRIFVETLFNLKQETIAYNEDGTIKGTKEISASTLSDLIKKTSVPLGRPVLNVKKKLYSKESDNINASEETEVYFEDFDDEN